MSQKSKIYKAINREYEQIRSQNQAKLRERKEAVYSSVPRIRGIEEEISLIGISVGRLVLREPERAIELAEKLRQDMKRLREEKEELLAVNGFEKNVLNMDYNCSNCNDTGYIAAEKCRCMKQKLMDGAYDQSNVRKIIEVENFDTFQLKYYSDTMIPDIGQTQREYIQDIMKECMNFTKYFHEEFKNLLIYGGTGLGKTFLCNCIAKELLDKGHTVLYMTAGQLFKLIEDQRFGKNDEEEKEDYTADILEADLFIIDDLGTEFTTILSTSELFHIINARLLQRKPVVVSTNLSPANLINQYSDRVVSRLIGEYEVLGLIGEDIRRQKKFH